MHTGFKKGKKSGNSYQSDVSSIMLTYILMGVLKIISEWEDIHSQSITQWAGPTPGMAHSSACMASAGKVSIPWETQAHAQKPSVYQTTTRGKGGSGESKAEKVTAKTAPQLTGNETRFLTLKRQAGLCKHGQGLERGLGVSEHLLLLLGT